MADYTTSTDVKAQIAEGFASTDTSYDTLLAALITSASRLIDREVGKWPDYFYPSTSDTVRYFDGNETPHLWIDDAVSITTVSVSDSGGRESSDYTDWSSSDWIAWPYNTTPITRIDVDVLNGSYSLFDAYPKSVKVTGVFGYSATPPEDVRQACEIQVLRWFMRAKQAYADNGANAAFGQVNINLGTRTSNRLDPDVAAILWPYKIIGAA